MKPQAQPMIAVKDVQTSARWYAMLLDLTPGHGGKHTNSYSLKIDSSCSSTTWLLKMNVVNLVMSPYTTAPPSRSF